MRKAPRLLLFAAGVVGLLGFPTAAATGPERPTSAGTVTAVAGPVTVVRLAAPPEPLKFRDSLYWRDVVEAGKDGVARVLLAGKTTVTVRELSRLELREEVLPEGVRYTVELASGKVRAAVARMLMQQGEQLQVRTRNAVASVRGTDFVVETVNRERAARAASVETVVVTVSGVVEVSNRVSGGGRVERIGPNEGARVIGTQDPVKFRVSADDLRLYLRGLTPPRPRQVRSGDRADTVGNRVEQGALATSVLRGGASSQSGSDSSQGQGSASGSGQDSSSGGGQGSTSGGGQGSSSGGDQGGGGQGSGQGSGQASSSGGGQGSSSGGGQGGGQGGGVAGGGGFPGGGQGGGLPGGGGGIPGGGQGGGHKK